MKNEIIKRKTEAPHDSSKHEVRLGMFDEPLHVLLDLPDEVVYIVFYYLSFDHGGWCMRLHKEQGSAAHEKETNVCFALHGIYHCNLLNHHVFIIFF